MKYTDILAMGALALLLVAPVFAQAEDPTRIANTKVYAALDFSNQDDYINATRGLIASPASLTICKEGTADPTCDGNGVCHCPSVENSIWDLTAYGDFIKTAPLVNGANHLAPASVNPSLWRNAQLNMNYGLFRVFGDGSGNTPKERALDDTFGIYQVRGYDLSNITFVRGGSGWIVFDPLISPETAKAALDLINTQLDPEHRRVSVVVYSHSHIDHYGGAPGLFPGDPDTDAEFIAPEGFTEHAVSENVIAGNAMGRRAVYMYGSLLPRNELGSVNAGLGQTSSTGVAGLIRPTIMVAEANGSFINADGTAINLGDHDLISDGDEDGAFLIDGVQMVFQMTPGTEAPAEMNTWFPDYKALWMAENTTNTMHNILTLRGAQVRDAYKWSFFLNETIEAWGEDAVVKFQSHHWPLWDDTPADPNKTILEYLKKQRDIYKFTHDQTVRLMNNGYNGEEISEMIALPEELETNWATRGYYGTLRHNSRAVYQFYMGWYNGHPSDLNNLPPQAVAHKYMEYMESSLPVYDMAMQDYLNGEYRWVAEVMKHAVFSNPNDEPAKVLLAMALEQLGYQAESGPWRSVYLQGASELRQAPDESVATETATPDTIAAMTPEMVFDFLAAHLCPEPRTTVVSGLLTVKDPENNCTEGAAGKSLTIDIDLSDNDHYVLTVENSVLNYSKVLVPNPDVHLTMTLEELQGILSAGWESIPNPSNGNELAAFNIFKGMQDLDDNFWFNIVLP